MQAGLLALDLACVTGQEALPLEQHAEVRVDLDERPCDAVADRPRIAAYLQSERRIAFNEWGIFRAYRELDA